MKRFIALSLACTASLTNPTACEFMLGVEPPAEYSHITTQIATALTNASPLQKDLLQQLEMNFFCLIERLQDSTTSHEHKKYIRHAIEDIQDTLSKAGSKPSF